jgi:hypothetical protein
MMQIIDRLLLVSLGAYLVVQTSYHSAGWFVIGFGVAMTLGELHRQVMSA